MIATPDYDATVTELGDPFKVLDELAAGLAQDPPRITQAPDVDLEGASIVDQ